jgi:hypothetical protein
MCQLEVVNKDSKGGSVKAKTSAIRLFSIAVMLLAPAAHAQSDESAAMAHRLMIRSGLSVQLRGFSDQIVGDIRLNAARLDERMVAALVDAAKEAFRPDVLQQDMTARIAKKLTVGDMKAALAWLETDAGKRVTRAEELASASFDAERIRGYAEGLKTKPVAAKRQTLISEMMAATGAVRAAAATAETMALGVAIGMDSLQPRERRLGEAGLRARIREAMPPEKIQAAFAQQLPVMYAYMYRDVSDADLGGYVGFLKGVAGKRYQDGMNAAFIEGLGRASVQVGELTGQRQRQTAL